MSFSLTSVALLVCLSFAGSLSKIIGEKHQVLKDHARDDKVRYDNYTVYRTWPRTDEQVRFLFDLSQTGEYDFWSDHVVKDSSCDIMVEPKLKHKFIDTINAQGIKWEVWVENVQDLIDSTATESPDHYENYSIYRVAPATAEHGKLLHELRQNSKYAFQSTQCHVGRLCTVMVGPKHQQEFVKVMTGAGIQWTLLISNVQAFLVSLLRLHKAQ